MRFQKYSVEILLTTLILVNFFFISLILIPALPSKNDENNPFWVYHTGAGIDSTSSLLDVNNNGYTDVLVGSIDGILYCIEGKNGTVLWDFNTRKYYYNSEILMRPLIADIDNNGTFEVIIGTRDGSIYVLSSVDGSLIWRFNYEEGGSISIEGGLSITDIDNDQDSDIIVTTTYGLLYVLDGKDGTLLWENKLFFMKSFFTSSSLGDINHDGISDIIVGCGQSIFAFNGYNGFKIWEFETNFFVTAPAAIGDVDSDSSLEIIVGSNDRNIYMLDGDTGKIKWKFKTGGSIRASPALGDLNNDGYLDIVIGSSDSYYYAFNGKTRTIFWTLKTELILGGTAPTLADVDGNNELDVLLNGKNVYIVGGRKGNLIYIYNQDEEIETSITVGDLDNDGSFEIIYVSKSGNVFCYTITNSLKTSYRIYWQGDGGNFFNSGNSFTIDKDGDTISTFSEKIIGTDPEKKDTDGDFLIDGYEISATKTDPLLQDSDNNNIGDQNEDIDGDGLTNLEEFKKNTDPLNRDTDEDFIQDNIDIFPILFPESLIYLSLFCLLSILIVSTIVKKKIENKGDKNERLILKFKMKRNQILSEISWKGTYNNYKSVRLQAFRWFGIFAISSAIMINFIIYPLFKTEIVYRDIVKTSYSTIVYVLINVIYFALFYLLGSGFYSLGFSSNEVTFSYDSVATNLLLSSLIILSFSFVKVSINLILLPILTYLLTSAFFTLYSKQKRKISSINNLSNLVFILFPIVFLSLLWYQTLSFYFAIPQQILRIISLITGVLMILLALKIFTLSSLNSQKSKLKSI